jgi:hypothetical protein
MNYELEMMWKDAVVVYTQVPSRHSLGRGEKNHENISVRTVTFPADIRTRHFPNTRRSGPISSLTFRRNDGGLGNVTVL